MLQLQSKKRAKRVLDKFSFLCFHLGSGLGHVASEYLSDSVSIDEIIEILLATDIEEDLRKSHLDLTLILANALQTIQSLDHYEPLEIAVSINETEKLKCSAHSINIKSDNFMDAAAIIGLLCVPQPTLEHFQTIESICFDMKERKVYDSMEFFAFKAIQMMEKCDVKGNV